jgi:hypothetical protein
MSGSYLLAIDAGTASCRALLFTQKGEEVTSSLREWTHHEPPDGPGCRDFTQLGLLGLGARPVEYTVLGGTFWQNAILLDRPLIDPSVRLRTLCHIMPSQWMLGGIGLYRSMNMRWFRDAFCAAEVGQARPGGGQAACVRAIEEAAAFVARGHRDGITELTVGREQRTRRGDLRGHWRGNLLEPVRTRVRSAAPLPLLRARRCRGHGLRRALRDLAAGLPADARHIGRRPAQPALAVCRCLADFPASLAGANRGRQ